MAEETSLPAGAGPSLSPRQVFPSGFAETIHEFTETTADIQFRERLQPVLPSNIGVPIASDWIFLPVSATTVFFPRWL